MFALCCCWEGTWKPEDSRTDLTEEVGLDICPVCERAHYSVVRGNFTSQRPLWKQIHLFFLLIKYCYFTSPAFIKCLTHNPKWILPIPFKGSLTVLSPNAAMRSTRLCGVALRSGAIYPTRFPQGHHCYVFHTFCDSPIIVQLKYVCMCVCMLFSSLFLRYCLFLLQRGELRLREAEETCPGPHCPVTGDPQA